MTGNDLFSRLEVALGGICQAPKTPPSAGLLELPVTAENFEKLLRHWAILPAGSRPRLRGFTVSREAGRGAILLLGIGPKAPLLLVDVDPAWTTRSLRGIWPYASWWEDELSRFETRSFPPRLDNSGVSWRRD